MMWAEYSAHPRLLVVHDPVAAGAMRNLSRVGDDARLESEWLFRSRPNEARYAEQHRSFVETLRSNVAQVLYLSEILGDDAVLAQANTNPNQVFTRDSLITLPWRPGGYIGARMKPFLRRPETRTMRAAVETLGLRELAVIPEGLVLEGGDLVPFEREKRRCLLIGHGPRTSFDTIEYLQGALIPDLADEIIAIELAPWRMNLDGGFLPVASDVLIAEPESILAGVLLDGRGRHSVDVLSMMRDLGMRIIETTRDESVFSQSCNCVCLGDRKVVYYDLCDRVQAQLVRHDIKTLQVPGSELVKGRGGPRCMTRPIY